MIAVMELLVKQVWYQNLARVRGMWLRGVRSKISATCPSYTTRLPPEIVEIIIAHLVYDTQSTHMFSGLFLLVQLPSFLFFYLWYLGWSVAKWNPNGEPSLKSPNCLFRTPG